MKARASVHLFLLLALPAGAFAQDPVPWRHEAYVLEFNYFLEGGELNSEDWNALPPGERTLRLEEAFEPSRERRQAVRDYYDEAMKPWSAAELEEYSDAVTFKDAAAVRLWLGPGKSAAFRKKIEVTGTLLRKARGEGLDDGDAAALSPYLTQQAITDLRSLKAAASLRDQAAAPSGRRQNEGAASSALKGMTAALGDAPGTEMARVFDGATASGAAALPDAAAKPSSRAYGLPGGAVGGAVPGLPGTSGQAAGGTAPRRAAAQQPATTPPAPAARENKASSAWTSDAYGITVHVAGREQPLTFRKARDAEAAIRRLPDASITKVILYGHGSPGMQTVGDDAYDSGSTAAMLKGKLARGGQVQFSGCNTASIGGPSVNPAVGISMAARRLLYFSLPYFQDRLDGVPAAQAREQWEKTWDADLAKDTSREMRGAVVCGYRTFGLVPGRLPGLTRLMGNQEATTPGYVAGKKVCYQDGREVPAP